MSPSNNAANPRLETPIRFNFSFPPNPLAMWVQPATGCPMLIKALRLTLAQLIRTHVVHTHRAHTSCTGHMLVYAARPHYRTHVPDHTGARTHES